MLRRMTLGSVQADDVPVESRALPEEPSQEAAALAAETLEEPIIIPLGEDGTEGIPVRTRKRLRQVLRDRGIRTPLLPTPGKEIRQQNSGSS